MIPPGMAMPRPASLGMARPRSSRLRRARSRTSASRICPSRRGTARRRGTGRPARSAGRPGRARRAPCRDPDRPASRSSPYLAFALCAGASLAIGPTPGSFPGRILEAGEPSARRSGRASGQEDEARRGDEDGDVIHRQDPVGAQIGPAAGDHQRDAHLVGRGEHARPIGTRRLTMTSVRVLGVPVPYTSSSFMRWSGSSVAGDRPSRVGSMTCQVGDPELLHEDVVAGVGRDDVDHRQLAGERDHHPRRVRPAVQAELIERDVDRLWRP